MVIAPVLAGVAFGSVKSRRLATTALPAISHASPARTPQSASTITHAACCAAPAAANICSTTSCTGRPSSPLCSLERRACWACSPACCAGGAHEELDFQPVDASLLPRDPGHGEALQPRTAARLLSWLQHDVAESLLGRGHAPSRRPSASTASSTRKFFSEEAWNSGEPFSNI